MLFNASIIGGDKSGRRKTLYLSIPAVIVDAAGIKNRDMYLTEYAEDKIIVHLNEKRRVRYKSKKEG